MYTINSRKRLAFSCAGEGFGHIARIVALAEYLKDDYDLIYFIPDADREFLTSHLGRVTTVSIPSFHFVLKNHGIDYLKTAADNASYLFSFGNIVRNIKAQLAANRVDALICDFEPFVSRAAVSLKIPLMNFSHPGILIKTLPLTPTGIISRCVSRFMTPGAQVNAFCSFYNGETGPVIRKELQKLQPVSGDFFLVYVKNDSKKKILETIQQFPEYRFKVYPGESGSFAEALANCRGVIAPAGHQLISEALYFGKPILVFPQKGQYEQTVNARMLKKSGRGFYGRMNHIQQDIKKFFNSIDSFPFPQDPFEQFCFTDDTPHILALIHRFIKENTAAAAPVTIYTYFDALRERLEFVQRQREQNKRA